MPVLLSAACAFLLLGALLQVVVIPRIKDWRRWREKRFLHESSYRVLEYASALAFGFLLFYCFSHLKNILSWLILAPTFLVTIVYGVPWLKHRYGSTPLLRTYAEYHGSGQLDERGRERIVNAADALTAPLNTRNAEAQVLRLHDVVRRVDPAFIMPAMDDVRAQLAYLQSHLLAIVLKNETGHSLEDLPATNNPEINALWNLARHNRTLRRVPTQLVKEDARDMRELYDELTALVKSGHEFNTLTARLANSDTHPDRKRPRDPQLEGARIFQDAFDGIITKAEAYKRLAEAEKKLREDVAEGLRSKEDVERDIENLRDLLARKFDELGL